MYVYKLFKDKKQGFNSHLSGSIMHTVRQNQYLSGSQLIPIHNKTLQKYLTNHPFLAGIIF